MTEIIASFITTPSDKALFVKCMHIIDSLPNPLMQRYRKECMFAIAFIIVDVYRSMFLQIESIIGDAADASIVSSMVSYRFHGMRYISQKWLRIPSLVYDIAISEDVYTRLPV